MVVVESIHKAIGARQDEWVKRLGEAVAIKSVSATPAMRPTVVKMAEWLRDQIVKDHPTAKAWFVYPKEKEAREDDTTLDLPPLVLAEVGNDPKKRTVLIYAHYDVQPAEKSDGWDTDPWILTMNKEEMRGRGTTDDKGPLVGWLNVLRVYAEQKRDIPVNIKFLCEGMEESGSVGFDSTAAEIAKTTDFFKNVDFCCVSDNYWLSTKKACLSYGLRGLTSVQVEIKGPARDLHSGSYGGMVYQPMDDLMYILGKLKDQNDKILIPDLEEQILPVTEEEKALYQKIEVDLVSNAHDIGLKTIRHEGDKERVLMDIWRFPSLTIHGIEGAFYESGFKTVIPKHVIGKFSIRLVPNQTGEHVEACVRKYIEKIFAERKSPNQMKIFLNSGRWFYVNPLSSRVFKAAAAAVKDVWGYEPDYTREGGSIPVTLTMSELTGQDLCLIPMGRSDDGAHSQNEKLDMSNYVEGMKVFSSFLEELATV